MISISKYIGETPDERTAAMLRVPYTLLEALVAHSVKFDPAEDDKNRGILRKLRNDLESAKDSTDVLQASGGIVRAIEAHNHAVARQMELRAEEMHTVVGMLMCKLQQMADGNGTSVDNLRQIKQKLDKATAIGDVLVLKKELAESLQGIQREAVQQQEQAAALVSHVHELASKVVLPAVSAVDSDPVTGLPGPRTAELAMQRGIDSHVPTYVVLFTLAVGSVSRRYGHGYDDEVLGAFAKQLASKLSPGDPLFRWKGPTMLGLLERPDSKDAAPPEVTHMSTFKPEFTLDIGGKATKIHLSMSSISLQLTKYASVTAVQQVLEQCQNAVAPSVA